jgi:hypothetical protein
VHQSSTGRSGGGISGFSPCVLRSETTGKNNFAGEARFCFGGGANTASEEKIPPLLKSFALNRGAGQGLKLQ